MERRKRAGISVEEEMLGQALESIPGAARFTDGSDEMIGRSHVGEYSFAAAVGVADPAKIRQDKTPKSGSSTCCR